MIRLPSKAIFIGGLPVTYSFNDHQFSASTSRSIFEMKIDHTLIDKAEEDSAKGDWRGISQNAPLVLIRLTNGGEIPIHGAYFEKEGKGKNFASEWVKDFNDVLEKKRKAKKP